jgi:hypothetical protein
MHAWETQVAELKIPYPARVHLARELACHLAHAPEEQDPVLSADELADFYAIHNTWLLRALERVPERLRLAIELLLAGGPMTALLVYVKGESIMFDFIKQGGAGMHVILVVGALLLLRELHLLWRTLVIKDHSRKNLRLDTPSVAIGALALVLIGLGATGMGIFYAASYVEHQNLPATVFIQGLREASTCFIVSSVLAALVLLLHVFTRRTLLRWKVPAELVG